MTLPKEVSEKIEALHHMLRRFGMDMAEERVALESAILSALSAAREGAMRERNEAADVSREAYIGSVERVVKALAAGAPMCLTCGKPATCVGAYECSENLDFACEECCSHGNEDGWCVLLASRPEPEPRQFGKFQPLATCGRCGRGGLTSVTMLGGINLCALCAAKVIPAAQPAIPLDGPGSHRWDLAEMRAQTKRADRAESDLAALRAKVEALAGEWERCRGGPYYTERDQISQEHAKALRSLLPGGDATKKTKCCGGTQGCPGGMVYVDPGIVGCAICGKRRTPGGDAGGGTGR